MGLNAKIKKFLLQTAIVGISIILVSFISVRNVTCFEIKDWIIVDKAWLDKNLGGNDKDITTQGTEDPSNPTVLFIEVAPDSEYTGWNSIENKWGTFKGYASEHIGKKKGGKILWEAIHTEWPSAVDRDTSKWAPGIQPNHYPNFVLDTMKSSADVSCLTTENKWCTRKAPGMLGLLDPITATNELKKFGVSHGVSSAKNNDIHIVIYAELLHHDYLYATTLYWLFDFYGYPSKNLHILNGGKQKWKNDGGPVVSGKGPTINPADYRFIPKLRPTILADKTLIRAVTKGVMKGIILDVRGDRANCKDPLEPGGIPGWPSSPNWWDPMQGYHIPNDEPFSWDDSLEKNAEGKCIDYKGECVWKYGLEAGLKKTFEARSIGKDDLIILY